MKALKILLGLIVVVIAIVAIAAVLVFKNLDDLIKTVIETEGSKVTQVSVTLDSVNTEITEGRIELNGLSVANPKGFDGAYLFDMDKVSLQVEPESLAGDVIVVNEILIDAAKISAELKGKNTNLQALQKNVAESTKSMKSKADTAESAPKSTGEQVDVRLMIEKFSFVNSNLQLNTDQWGSRTVTMPNLVMKNLGSRDKGLTPEELSKVVMARLSAATQKAVEKEITNIAKDKAKERLQKELDERLSDKDKEKLDQLKGLFGR